MYHIEAMQINIGEEIRVVVDGAEQKDKMTTLVDDGEEHNVHVASVCFDYELMGGGLPSMNHN